MQVHAVSVLWVDLCADEKNAQDIAAIDEMDAIFTIRRGDKNRIASTIEEERPHLICLDYDFPDRQSLQLLRQLRCEYPDIPVIMMTVQHCESLAVWAFRTGVRDYLVKPLSVNAINEELNVLATLAKPHAQNQRAPRRNLLPPTLLPNEFRNGALPLRADCTILAMWKCILMKGSQRKI